MKRWTSFILILLSSMGNASYACGPFYPSGDLTRICLFRPSQFPFQDFGRFNYSASIFYSMMDDADSAAIELGKQSNISLWKHYCQNIPSAKDIYEAVYEQDDSLHRQSHKNSFINYLFKRNDTAAIQYLDFIRICSEFNRLVSDPWEREDNAKLSARTKLIEAAIQRAKYVKAEQLKRRYAFIAIRLAHYNQDSTTINFLYKTYFDKRTERDIIDYWSMYFKAIVERNKIRANYYSALVFANAPDKRLTSYLVFDKTVPLAGVLACAKDNAERSAILLLAATKKSGRADTDIQNIYRLTPHNSALNFLLLREVNKLEDWILTPYYTQYVPSLMDAYDIDTTVVNKRIVKDKIYVLRLLDLVKSMDLKKVDNPVFIKSVKAYLYFLNNNYDDAIAVIDELQNSARKVDDVYKKQWRKIKALSLVARQVYGKAIVLDAVKSLIMKAHENEDDQFVFAIARELEFKGNTTDAAMLLSKAGSVSWRKERRYNIEHASYFDWYYDNYFFYIDEQYTPEETKALADAVEHVNRKDKFAMWAVKDIAKELPRLYDLVGTKYIRLDQLDKALFYFKQVSDTLWHSDKYVYKDFLDANPFYADFYSEHQSTAGDTIKFTKPQITQKLIAYLNRAQDTHNSQRDYYYFLVANCYYNMSTFGNSWMMRRYSWSVEGDSRGSKFPDNNDFYSASRARRFYMKAKELSHNKKFAALCLRMAGKCEYLHRLRLERGDAEERGREKVNLYYKQLKEQYPAYYDELMGNCESFREYLGSRM